MNKIKEVQNTKEATHTERFWHWNTGVQATRDGRDARYTSNWGSLAFHSSWVLLYQVTLSEHLPGLRIKGQGRFTSANFSLYFGTRPFKHRAGDKVEPWRWADVKDLSFFTHFSIATSILDIYVFISEDRMLKWPNNDWDTVDQDIHEFTVFAGTGNSLWCCWLSNRTLFFTEPFTPRMHCSRHHMDSWFKKKRSETETQ